MLRFRGLKSQYLPRGNNTQLFKYLGINWKTSMEFLLNLNFLLWAGEFTENPWQHIKLSHLSLQTRFFVLRHLRKQQLHSESSTWNQSSFPPHQNFNSTSNWRNIFHIYVYYLLFEMNSLLLKYAPKQSLIRIIFWRSPVSRIGFK